MRTLKELGNSQKYLKATSVASYRSDIAYDAPRWSFRKGIHLKDGWNLLLRKTQYVFGEYAISNAFVFAFVAKTRSRQRLRLLGRCIPDRPCSVCVQLDLRAVGADLSSAVNGADRSGNKIRFYGTDFLQAAACRNQPSSTQPSHQRRRSCIVVGRGRIDARENFFGKPFMVYKFRTMVVDAEKRCGPVWATKNDPRTTRIGRFLRKTRLDELPQLLNVIKGEMSLVGPRPERPYLHTAIDETDRYL